MSAQTESRHNQIKGNIISSRPNPWPSDLPHEVEMGTHRTHPWADLLHPRRDLEGRE
jgi:hypothetical protein